MSKHHQFVPAVICTLLVLGCSMPQEQAAEIPEAAFPVLTGEYLGQTPPGLEPEVFAPGIVSTGAYDRDVAMMPDGKEIYWGVALGRYKVTAIMVSKLVDGQWTKPEVAPFSADPEIGNFEPCIAPSGDKLYLISDRPLPEGDDKGKQDVWVLDRLGDGWGEPYNLGPPVNSEAAEYFPSVTRDHTIYFTRQEPDRRHMIYRSRLVDGTYAEAEKLPPEVNSGPQQYNAFVAADESYLIIPTVGREDSLGATDYYVSFRNPDDTWTPAVHMGEKVNTPADSEYSASVSPDGKYLFCMAARPAEVPGKTLTWEWMLKMQDQPQNGNADIFWVDASFITELRPQE